MVRLLAGADVTRPRNRLELVVEASSATVPTVQCSVGTDAGETSSRSTSVPSVVALPSDSASSRALVKLSCPRRTKTESPTLNTAPSVAIALVSAGGGGASEPGAVTPASGDLSDAAPASGVLLWAVVALPALGVAPGLA